MRCGDPGFLTVDHEAIAVAHRAGGHAAQVRSCTRLGKGDRFEVPAAQVAQDFFLLLLVAMAQVRLRSGQPGAVGVDRRLPARGLLQEDALLDHPRASAAVVDW